MLNKADMNVSVCFLGVQPREALTHVLLEIINKTMCVRVCLCVSVCLCVCVHAWLKSSSSNPPFICPWLLERTHLWTTDGTLGDSYTAGYLMESISLAGTPRQTKPEYFNFWIFGHTWNLNSSSRDGTSIPCTGRQSLDRWTTREVPFIWCVCVCVCVWPHCAACGTSLTRDWTYAPWSGSMES